MNKAERAYISRAVALGMPIEAISNLRTMLNYDMESGVFTWKMRRGHVKAGSIAGSNHSDGYISIRINKKHYYAHRLAWAFVNDIFPEIFIDHINGNPADNRFINLREATNSINMQNIRVARKDNKSGLLGAMKNRDKFSSCITVNGKNTFLGVYETAELAHEAYIHAKRILHPGCMI